MEAEAKGKPAKAAPPPKRDRDDPIAAALKDAPEETRTKKDRSGRAKKQKQEEDKFDALVEQYKKRMMGVQLKSDDWM